MEEDRAPQDLLEMLLAGQPKEKTEVDSSTVRYALYARKSTLSEDSQAHSIEDQVSVCMERIVIPNNLHVEKIYRESFSAKEADTREQFKQMVSDLKTGRVNGLIAWHPDRLARNMKDAGEIIDLIDKNTITDLKFATFTFENTAEGKMTLGITFVMSKQYSEHLSDSVNRGNQKNVVDRGEFIGKFKHGYVVDGNRRFQVDNENFVKVRHVFQTVLNGNSQKEAREWINSQNYTVQKRPESDPVPHTWSKDNISELLRDPHYAGVHKWGKNFVDLTQQYDFTPMVTVEEFLKINKINNLDSSKILSISRPKSTKTKANLLRGAVYCGACGKPLTSMLIGKKKDGVLLHSRYYYKCETKSCRVFDNSARAELVINKANEFFNTFLFTTRDNYEVYIENARKELKKMNANLASQIESLKATISNKEKAYEQTKKLLLKDSVLEKHYNLDKQLEEINKLKSNYERQVNIRRRTKESLPTYEKYLKLFESAPVILNKIRDMSTMDQLLRIFFLNFTVIPGEESFSRGSEVTCKLKEPWAGFLNDEKFVYGAGEGTLTPGLVLGKDAL